MECEYCHAGIDPQNEPMLESGTFTIRVANMAMRLTLAVPCWPPIAKV